MRMELEHCTFPTQVRNIRNVHPWNEATRRINFQVNSFLFVSIFSAASFFLTTMLTVTVRIKVICGRKFLAFILEPRFKFQSWYRSRNNTCRILSPQFRNFLWWSIISTLANHPLWLGGKMLLIRGHNVHLSVLYGVPFYMEGSDMEAEEEMGKHTWVWVVAMGTVSISATWY